MGGDFPEDEARVEVEEGYNPFDEAFERTASIRGFRGEVHLGFASSAVIGRYIAQEWEDFDAARFMRGRRGAVAAYVSSVEIDRPFRGSGRGRALFDWTLRWLDARGIAYTYLIPVPTSYDAPSADDLRRWYGGFGFRSIAGTRFMVRPRPNLRVRQQRGRIR